MDVHFNHGMRKIQSRRSGKTFDCNNLVTYFCLVIRDDGMIVADAFYGGEAGHVVNRFPMLAQALIDAGILVLKV